MLGEGDELLGPVLGDDADLGDAVGEPQGGLHGLGQALADVVASHQPVHHHLDGVLLVPGQAERGPVRQLHHLAVDAGPGESLLGQVVEERLVLPLASPHHGGEHLEARALGQVEDAVDDLLGGLTGDGPAAIGAVGPAHPGVEQSEVVVDLGDRSHRRPGVATGGLLVDGDGRRQSLDEVDVGLVHLTQELAGVGGQRLDVAALAFGVDGVEGERRLARPRQAGEDDEPVARQLERDVAQVVLSSPADHQPVSHRWEATGGAGGRFSGPGRHRRGSRGHAVGTETAIPGAPGPPGASAASTRARRSSAMSSRNSAASS